MAYDIQHQRTVMLTRPENPVDPDTWEWAGDDWTLRSQHVSGPPFATAMVFDPIHSVCVTFGGSSGVFLPTGETWKWDGSSWTELTPALHPPDRYLHGMAFDSARDVAVVFGGQYCDDNGQCLSYGDTWEYDGQTWTERQIPGPSARHSIALAYDQARGVTVLYGGNTAQGLSDETWEYDGQAWTLVAVGGPGKRSGHSMVYDADRGVTVLFGGVKAGGVYQNDLWEWDGATWEEVTADDRPAPRANAGLAYDSARKAVVLFGGFAKSPVIFSDTWEFICTPPCFADLDGNLKLDLFDFLAFVNLFNADDLIADCDGNKALDLFDFLCFTNAFNAGC